MSARSAKWRGDGPDNPHWKGGIENYVPEPNSGCWLWLGGSASKQGHGNIRIAGRNYLAHRVMYERSVGPIPPGLVLDHLCRVPCCINPAHLEPVTIAENNRRGQRWGSA